MPYANIKAQREYGRKWRKRRRDRWIKENGPCNKCGSWENLEVDHIDPKKKEARVSTIWSWTKERREKELNKCQVLCQDCHLEKTREEQVRLGYGPYSDRFKPGTTILTKHDVIEIKQRLRKGESQSSIAKDFPVGRQAINKINTGKSWTEVKV